MIPWLTGDIMIALAAVLMSVLTVALVLAFIRLAIGPSLPDRVVALDLMTIILVGMIVLYTMYTGETVYLDAAITLSVIAFLGTVAFARYVNQRALKSRRENEL